MKRYVILLAVILIAGCTTEPTPESRPIKLNFSYKFSQVGRDSLYPVYPNPYSRTAGDTALNIRFALRDTTATTVLVQNALGDAIASFSDSLLPAGLYSGSWNPSASDGTPLISGVYFVTLRAGDFINSRLVFIQANQ